MATVNVGGSWVPSVPPVRLSRLGGATKKKNFTTITPGTHTLVILADIALRNGGAGSANFDPKKKAEIAIVLLDKHQQKVAEDTMVADASSPFVSYTFKLTPDQCPASLRVRAHGEGLDWLKSTKIFMRVIDGDLIRNEADMTAAARRLAKDFPYLVRFFLLDLYFRTFSHKPLFASKLLVDLGDTGHRRFTASPFAPERFGCAR
jgi:hypothetical protein